MQWGGALPVQRAAVRWAAAAVVVCGVLGKCRERQCSGAGQVSTVRGGVHFALERVGGRDVDGVSVTGFVSEWKPHQLIHRRHRRCAPLAAIRSFECVLRFGKQKRAAAEFVVFQTTFGRNLKSYSRTEWPFGRCGAMR